jgi:hypothetical protein
VISVEVKCLATLGQQWRLAVHSLVLSARINPGSPGFGIVARIANQHFNWVANVDYFTVVALFGTVGALTTLSQRIFR